MTADSGKEKSRQENGSGAGDSTMNINTDESISGTSHLNEPVSQEDETEKLEAENSELRDKYLRQAAEFDNYRKRVSREMRDLTQTAGREVIQSLLVVLDDIERAEKQITGRGNIDTVDEGVLLVFTKLRTILQARGLKPMESVGADFDPDKHEAVAEIPAPNPELQGKVLDEAEKGYYLGDKIIRFAKVVVGK